MEIKKIKVSDIVADKEQPRKYFNELRLKDLASSVKEHGVKVPIVVEDFGNGKFLLVDGERRYRTAVHLGLKEIPAIVEAPKKSTDRLIEQFHLQEQHEGWNSIEKANAIRRLSDELGISLSELVVLLNLPYGTVRSYMAVSSLVDKEKFEAQDNIPLTWIPHIVTAKNRTKRLYETNFKEKFLRSDEKKFEHAVLKAIRAGSINKRSDFAKLGDVFETEPTQINKFLDSDLNIETAYYNTDAEGVNSVRSATTEGRFLTKKLKIINESKNVKLTDTIKIVLKNLKKELDILVSNIE